MRTAHLLLALAGVSLALAEQPSLCSPLTEAERILESLQPSPDAHLHSKAAGIVPFSNEGWADGLGWRQNGPLSTAFRLLPRVVSAFSPSRLLSSTAETMSRSSEKKVSRGRRERIEKITGLIDEAEKNGCSEALMLKAEMGMFPPRGLKQDLQMAYESLQKYLEQSSDPEAQFLVGVFHATGLGGVSIDQGKALLYYTFAASQGHRPAAMALGYRHWAGIGVKEDCEVALEHYSNAAEISYRRFQEGPPGGLALPLVSSRLSDRVGGIYGTYASWASTGANSQKPAIRASTASSRGETTQEILEYYQYHSDRDSHPYTVRLGRFFYHGSVHYLPNGVSVGAESIGEIPQSFTKARSYFLRVARTLWPLDFEPGTDHPAGRRKLTKEQEDKIREPAMVSAFFLGRMSLRGEGQKQDYKRAKMWYERASELGDREAMNGLGIIYRDGLGVPVDVSKAQEYFQAAASAALSEAQVNLAKLVLAHGDLKNAYPLLEAALRSGNPLEAFHLSARVHTNARSLSQPGVCGVAVAYEKIVSERGAWYEDYLQEADHAWARGETSKAMVGYYIAAEMGYEAAQNNVAFLREGGWKFKAEEEEQWSIGSSRGEDEEKDRLVWWIRSAGQDNVDAMVKIGDHYYTEGQYPRALSHYLSASETQQSPMAYWNLGWMHQAGLGVTRDWHLAKRYYDLSRDTGEEAMYAAGLSLAGLYIQSWWTHFKTRGATPGLALFDYDAVPVPASESLSTWARIKTLFTSPFEWADLEYAEDWEDNLEPDDIVLGEGDLQDDRGTGGDDWEAEMFADLAEDMVLVGLLAAIAGLVWVRARWAAANQRARARALEAAVQGQGQALPVPTGGELAQAQAQPPQRLEGDEEAGDQQRRQ
ncbi:hypothetical protein L202_01156 [Cryptococcus amylolentus CBS 6039]|uniref:DOD-type homing endonuclease domain-containing protein n=1 Tax=Cryptococcus amylolentus CBS 6039 TaxID=1295533 RepID=A0A1E3I3F9_9TREE|nr:hypothetical protein L202_01156 [Cryptococcus amylolentus CBS 6039]ODN82905.1 hypothetical protein L202_01156 [Cryptococcus amylolentus CBS 6039]